MRNQVTRLERSDLVLELRAAVDELRNCAFMLGPTKAQREGIRSAEGRLVRAIDRTADLLEIEGPTS